MITSAPLDGTEKREPNRHFMPRSRQAGLVWAVWPLYGGCADDVRAWVKMGMIHQKSANALYRFCLEGPSPAQLRR